MNTITNFSYLQNIEIFEKEYEKYTIDQIINMNYPIKIYFFKNKKDLIKKLWIKYEFLKKSSKNLNFTLNRLSFYYDREYEWQHILYNKHVCLQSIGNETQLYYYESDISYKNIRKYTDFDEQIKYNRSCGAERSVIQWGQRKLLIMEIYFMMKYSHLSDTVVYIGASPGTHLKYIAKCWKNHKFYLYDPTPFNKSLSNFPNLFMHQKLFTIEDANYWKDKNVLFISDIRSSDILSEKDLNMDNFVYDDMMLQKQFADIIKPVMASFKFRLPYKDGEMDYYDGDIYLQPWSTTTGTETRLYTTCSNIKKYNFKEYESKMFYHNKINRIKLYKIDNGEFLNLKKIGYDHCFDCHLEIYILNKFKNYTKKMHDIDISIEKISNTISNLIYYGRDLLSDNVDPYVRITGILQKQYNIKK
jgi:cap2 methyltransferase/cap3/cap4 methyltransferase